MDRNVTLSVRSLLVAGLVALAVVAAYLVGRAGPAPARADASDTPSTVTVTGLGRVSVVPDQLAFDLSVSVLRPELDQALDEANTAMQSVIDTLKESGVADKDVQTTDLSMYPEYDRKKGQPPALTGYRVIHSASVTVEDLDKASAIVTAAIDAGGTGVRVNGLRFQVGDPEGSLDEARTDAFEQAQGKAEEYAALAGRDLGAVVEVSEETDRPYTELQSSARDAVASASIPFQPGQRDLTASVVLVFELR